MLSPVTGEGSGAMQLLSGVVVDSIVSRSGSSAGAEHVSEMMKQGTVTP